MQWPVPKEFQTLIGAAPSAVSYQISSSWLCYQLAGAPSMAVNQAKATSADQTISWWSWDPLMNWGEGSAMGHRVTKKLSHTWTFFNPDVKENSCLKDCFRKEKFWSSNTCNWLRLKACGASAESGLCDCMQRVWRSLPLMSWQLKGKGHKLEAECGHHWNHLQASPLPSTNPYFVPLLSAFWTYSSPSSWVFFSTSVLGTYSWLLLISVGPLTLLSESSVSTRNFQFFM